MKVHDMIPTNDYDGLMDQVDKDIRAINHRTFTADDVKSLKESALIAFREGECDLIELAIVLSAFNTIRIKKSENTNAV